MNNIKILIVGAGHIGEAQISEALYKAGIDQSEVLMVQNDSDDLKQLVEFRNKTVKQRLEAEMLLEPNILQTCSDFCNYEKQNSQSGWKNRPKHKR